MLPGTDCFTNPSALPSVCLMLAAGSSRLHNRNRNRSAERALGGLASA